MNIEEKKIVQTADISGFPRDEHYEQTCQRLLWTGIKYLSKIDDQDIFRGLQKMNLKALEDTSFFGEIPVKKGDTIQFVGVLSTPESLKEMENEMSKAVKGDWTGAQHETVIIHLEKISKHGLKWWIQELRETQDDRIYEIDLDELFKKP